MNHKTPSVIIDAGTLNCKVGIAKEDGPQYCFLSKNATINQQSPIQDGIIKSWDQYENLLHNIFQNKLKINSKDYSCFITEVPNNPKINKEYLIQMIFEKFEAGQFYLQQQSVLTLISQGKQTGMVLDSGEGLTYLVPVFEGFQIPHAIKTINFAGRSCTNWLSKILIETGMKLSEQNIIQDIKEKFSYIALNFFEELQKMELDISKPYQLPDGTIINISSQRFRCPEILFQPHFLGFDIQGIHHQTYQSIMQCDQEVRQILFQNIGLSGGNTMFHGFEERLKKEISLMTNEQISIDAQPNRQYAVWIGGSILASLSSFNQNWITKQEYNEFGPQVIHQKCI